MPLSNSPEDIPIAQIEHHRADVFLQYGSDPLRQCHRWQAARLPLHGVDARVVAFTADFAATAHRAKSRCSAGNG
jgi:hypothetical protein